MILLIQMIFFLLAYVKRTDKFTDLAYSGMFVAVVIWLFMHSTQTLFHRILLVVVLAWGVRLLVYLMVRIIVIGKDDRFDEMRDRPLALLAFRLMQGTGIWIILFPVIAAMRDTAGGEITWVSWCGLLIRLIGWSIESIADMQKFRAKRRHPQRWVDTGLWRRARHPNYF